MQSTRERTQVTTLPIVLSINDGRLKAANFPHDVTSTSTLEVSWTCIYVCAHACAHTHCMYREPSWLGAPNTSPQLQGVTHDSHMTITWQSHDTHTSTCHIHWRCPHTCAFWGGVLGVGLDHRQCLQPHTAQGPPTEGEGEWVASPNSLALSQHNNFTNFKRHLWA